jgi:curved DNA-binding protein CbpA
MTHYDVLGVSSASSEEIRARYRELARLTHPDHGGDFYQFQVLSEAFAVLGDPTERAAYDRELGLGALGPQRASRQEPWLAEEPRVRAGERRGGWPGVVPSRSARGSWGSRSRSCS